MPTDYPPLITISGPPGSGTTTLAERVASQNGYEMLSGGDLFRHHARERGVSLAELTEMAEGDESIDRELDEQLRTVLENHVNGDRDPDGAGLIVESRLAGWLATDAHLSIWATAPLDVRVDRIADRDETAEELQRREESEADRYRSYYGIDITDLSVYDLVIDTSTVSAEGVHQAVEIILTDVVEREDDTT